MNTLKPMNFKQFPNPVLTYFSIISVFTLMVVMNNIHSSQHPNNKIQKKSMSFK